MNRRIPAMKMALLSALTISPAVLAYGGGGGGGGSSCEEPRFSKATPDDKATVPALGEFQVQVSGNTDLDTLDIKINGQKVQPAITPLRSGDSQILAQPAAPISTPGKVRITLRARSRDGCETFQAIYVEIKP